MRLAPAAHRVVAMCIEERACRSPAINPKLSGLRRSRMRHGARSYAEGFSVSMSPRLLLKPLRRTSGSLGAAAPCEPVAYAPGEAGASALFSARFARCKALRCNCDNSDSAEQR